jgi:hypothetical protein
MGASSRDFRSSIWWRRLFDQHDPDVPLAYGRDVGLTGPAGDVVIDDDYRLASFRSATTGGELAKAAQGWLTKVVANAMRGYRALNDQAIADAVDAALDTLAQATGRVTSDLGESLRRLPGTDLTGRAGAGSASCPRDARGAACPSRRLRSADREFREAVAQAEDDYDDSGNPDIAATADAAAAALAAATVIAIDALRNNLRQLPGMVLTEAEAAQLAWITSDDELDGMGEWRLPHRLVLPQVSLYPSPDPGDDAAPGSGGSC